MESVHARGQASAALGVLQKVIAAVGQGIPADRTLAELFRSERKFGSRDRRFISALVFSYFRWRGWLDGIELPRAAALAYALDAAEPHNAQTALAGEVLPAWGGLGLRAKCDELAALIGVPLARSALVPGWLRDVVPPAKFEQLIDSFQTRPQTWIRARADSVERVFSALAGCGAEPVRDARQPGAMACQSGTDFVSVWKRDGRCFEVQDISSQAVGTVCGAMPGERWWDVCAGAGGKSLHLADQMSDSGEIIASDVRASALRELEKRAGLAGLKSIHTLPSGVNSSGLFDGVLVDAPCSGIGTWSRNPDMRWRTDASGVSDKAALQLKIVCESAARVRPGGRLVFAVCTVTEPETTGVIARFQEAHPEFAPAPFVRWDSTEHHAWTIWPWEGPGDGMFVARFRRLR